MGIWICWELLDMPRCARRPGTAPWNEFARRPHDRARGPYNVKAEKPIVCHAEANSAALQEVVHSVTFRVEVIPLLCLSCVFACIQASVITTMVRVKRENVSASWAEHHQVAIVRVDPLVILLTSALTRNPVHVLVVLLEGLMRPREEEAAGAPILQAIRGGAPMKVEPRLDYSGKPRNPKMLPPVTSPCFARHVGSDHFGLNPCHFGVVVHIVLLVIALRNIGDSFRARSLLWPRILARFLDRRQCCVRLLPLRLPFFGSLLGITTMEPN